MENKKTMTDNLEPRTLNIELKIRKRIFLVDGNSYLLPGILRDTAPC
jgi:hypothetical protein